MCILSHLGISVVFRNFVDPAHILSSVIREVSDSVQREGRTAGAGGSGT